MSSTAIEFGLINTLRTNHVILDAMICMIIPLVIQRIMITFQQQDQTWWLYLVGIFYRKTQPKYLFRTIEYTQKYNRYGQVWDGEQQTHLLQKAIAMSLADVLNLQNKNARCELIEKKKKEEKNQDLTDVEKYSIEALPPYGVWIPLLKHVEFMHEIITPENSEDSKSVKEITTKYQFRSSTPQGSHRMDAWIRQAFENYQNLERAKYKKDTTRYFYIQSGNKPSSSDSNEQVVAYKRYPLGEEKTFENLFLDEKESILQLLNHFIHQTGKFAIRGFPYKLGFLLYGSPGTGKTSLIKAIAQHTKRHIVTINLSKIKTNQELLDAVFDLKFAVQEEDLPISMSFEDVVFVMEDIDCASKIVNSRELDDGDKKKNNRAARMVDSQKKATMKDEELGMKTVGNDDLEETSLIGPLLKQSDKGDRLNLSGLLNVLDGVIDCPGRIVIMTTNHPEKLDPALIRPGRVNKTILLTHMNCIQAQKMIEYYCSTCLTYDQQKRLEALFNKTLQKKVFTPAEIEEYCAEFDDPDSILNAMEEKDDEF